MPRSRDWLQDLGLTTGFLTQFQGVWGVWLMLIFQEMSNVFSQGPILQQRKLTN